MLMVNYLFCHAISSLMKTSIWIRPRQLSYRRMVYDELKNDPEKLGEIKEKIFLPSKAYPRRRGRKPKYDHLLISIEGITEEEARRVEDFAKEYFHRPVVSYRVKIQSPEGMKEIYRFILPWRDPETGKSIRTGKGVFIEMRERIKEAIRGESPEAHTEAMPVKAPQSPGSIPHDMAKTTEEHGDLAHAEKPEAPTEGEDVIKGLDEVEMLVKEEEKEKRLRELENRKKQLERKIASLSAELNSPITMLRVSKKKSLEKLKQELSEVNNEIRRLKKQI